MTLTYIPPVTLYLWLATAFWQIVVAIVVFRSAFHHPYPAFSSYASFVAIATPTLMVLPPQFYFLGYTIVSAITCILLWATLFELYIKVCAPSSLPSWAPRTMASWFVLAIAASLAATCGLYTVHLLPKKAAILVAAQGGMTMALFLALVVLLVYSKYLGMEWRTRPRQIVIGLAISFSVHSVVLFLINHVSLELATFLDRIGQVAFWISLIWWTFTLRKPEPAPEPVTQQMVDTILNGYHSTKEITDRIVLDKIIKNNCSIAAKACKSIGDSQEEDSPLYFAAYNTRREAIDLGRRCSRRGHAKDKSIPPAYDNFKDSVIHLFETTALADVVGKIPELL